MADREWIFGTSRSAPAIGVAGNVATAVMTQANMDALYKGTSLEGKVTALSGWQQYTVEKTALYKFVVQGSQGGHHGTTDINNPINYGGRGACLTAAFLLHKDDVLYICVGESGFCNNTADWGGAGGGASCVFLKDTSGESSYTFTPANAKIIPLVVAGGGAGQTDYSYGQTSGSMYSTIDISNDSCALNAKITDGTVTTAGTGRSAYNPGQGLTSGYGAAYTLLGGCALMSDRSYYRSGFGGGGLPYNGGGGGGGWSGGNFSDSYPSYGGTSHIDESGIMVERKLADWVKGKTVQGSVSMSLLTSPNKKILAKDSDGYKRYDADSASWVLMDTQTEPDSAAYGASGVNTAASVSGLKSPVKWLVQSDLSDEMLIFAGLLDRVVVKSAYDLDLSTVSQISKITADSDISGMDVKCAFSTDSGKTWKTYASGQWPALDIADRAAFSEKGVSLADVTSVPFRALLDLDGSSTIRLAFCVSETAARSGVFLKALGLTGIKLSGWESTVPGADYTYKYSSPQTLEVTVLKDGDYKINYTAADQ